MKDAVFSFGMLELLVIENVELEVFLILRIPLFRTSAL